MHPFYCRREKKNTVECVRCLNAYMNNNVSIMLQLFFYDSHVYNFRHVREICVSGVMQGLWDGIDANLCYKTETCNATKCSQTSGGRGWVRENAICFAMDFGVFRFVFNSNR